MKKIAVLGAGHGGYALSAELSLAGHEVSLYELSKFKMNIKPILKRGGIELSGLARVGFAKLSQVTTDIKEAVDGVDLILITVPAFAHGYFAEKCAPCLKDGQTVVYLGKGGGTLEFARVVRHLGIKKDITLGETNTLPFGCRIIGPAQVKIFVVAKELRTAALPAKKTGKLIETLKEIYPSVIPVSNVLETILNDMNAVLHPAPTILNAGHIEKSEEAFLVYEEGVTPSVARVIEAVDKERLDIMRVLGLKQIPFEELYFKTGFGPKGTILETATLQDAAKIVKVANLHSRYITEDVPYGLVTIACIGKLVSVPTPVINSLVTLASAINQVDYWKKGRTAERFGILGLSVDELMKFVTDGEL